jgi:hypothetical protein
MHRSRCHIDHGAPRRPDRNHVVPKLSGVGPGVLARRSDVTLPIQHDRGAAVVKCYCIGPGETARPQHGQPRSRSGRRGECMRTLVIILLVRYARRLRPAAGVGPGQLFPRRSWPLAGGQPTDVRERGAAECCRAGARRRSAIRRRSGTSTIRRVFRSGGTACHLVRHHIVVAGRRSGHDYRLTWCRTPAGEWRIKG